MPNDHQHYGPYADEVVISSDPHSMRGRIETMEGQLERLQRLVDQKGYATSSCERFTVSVERVLGNHRGELDALTHSVKRFSTTQTSFNFKVQELLVQRVELLDRLDDIDQRLASDYLGEVVKALKALSHVVSLHPSIDPQALDSD